jgi:hypothetical protein
MIYAGCAGNLPHRTLPQDFWVWCASLGMIPSCTCLGVIAKVHAYKHERKSLAIKMGQGAPETKKGEWGPVVGRLHTS